MPVRSLVTGYRSLRVFLRALAGADVRPWRVRTTDERVLIEGRFPCLGSDNGIPRPAVRSLPRIPQYGHLWGLSLR